MSFLFRMMTAVTLLLGIGSATALAQPSVSEMTTRVYRVLDIVVPSPDYDFQGIFLPGMSNGRMIGGTGPGNAGVMGGMGGGMGGGGMGGGGMGGFGHVAIPVHVHAQMMGGGMGGGMGGYDVPEASSRITMADLMETITNTIEPRSWSAMGGQASISALGGMLVVQQTAEIHDRIEQLLEALRQSGAVPQSVTCRAYWLRFDAGESEFGKAPAPMDRRQLQTHIDADRIVAQGQITCFDGQTVHIISGNLRSGVSSLIPVVGQHEVAPDGEQIAAADTPTIPVRVPNTVLAQHGEFPASISGGRDARVGYQPVMTSVNIGVLLQITPLLVTDASTVVVDVHNTVVAKAIDAEPLEPQPGMKLVPINFVAQQFQTTLRLPTGTPVIVGGMTLEPTTEHGKGQLLLVLEVTAGT